MKLWPLKIAFKAPRVHAAELYIGSGLGTQVTATAAEINAAADVATAGAAEASKGVILDANKVNDGVVVCLRARHAAAAITAGTATAVPAVTGKSFCVMDIRMRAVGGAVSGPTTVEVAEETSGEVFLSHVSADLTEDTWVGQAEGTPVITGITAGGMVVAGKKLLVTDTGGTAFATATHLDTIVVGYYTTA